MTNKERYELFCQAHPDMPIMMQPWWMEAVCAGKAWDVMLLTASDLEMTDVDGAEVVAAMPYLIRKRMGMKFIVMPQLTMFGGIWLDKTVYAYPKAQQRLARLIAKQLRKMRLAYYYQQFPIGNPLPEWLQDERMKTTRRVTYRTDMSQAEQQPDEQFSKNKQRQLHKAEDLQVDMEMRAEEFYRFHKSCMDERGRKLVYSREFLLVLEQKAHRAGQSAFIRVTGAMPDAPQGEKKTLAAAFVVWDKEALYYLIPAYLPSGAKSGASARLAYEALQLAKDKQLVFDFEGGNDDAGIAGDYRQLGGKETTYYSVEKLYNPLFGILLKLNKLREKYLMR